MTGRVFECVDQSRWSARTGVRGGSSFSRPPALKGFTPAVLTAMVMVPLAGAAEPPLGFGVAALTAIAMVLILRLLGTRAPYGRLGLLVASVGLLVPRGQLAMLGPGIVVVATVCLVVWAANRGSVSARERGRPAAGSPERAAQLSMGLAGERHVGQVLGRELPPEFVLINGLKLPRGAGDIDHLVVGPTGLFLLETKTMPGAIVCEPDGTWRRTKTGRAGSRYAAYIGDPAAQVQRNIFAVGQCLRRQVPELYRGTPLWIEGLVVFPHPRTELAAKHSRVPAVRLDEAVERICRHVPQRPLRPQEVDAVVEALFVARQARSVPRLATANSAQALVEVALALPLVLSLLFGTLALSRVIQAQTAVVAVAHQAARAGALGSSPADAVDRMRRRVQVVARDFGLDPRVVVLEWDVSSFARDPGQVVAIVRYSVDLADLPVAGWVPPPHVRAEHVEWLDPFRSGLTPLQAVGPDAR